jgi:hypothetical protein
LMVMNVLGRLRVGEALDGNLELRTGGDVNAVREQGRDVLVPGTRERRRSRREHTGNLGGVNVLRRRASGRRRVDGVDRRRTVVTRRAGRRLEGRNGGGRTRCRGQGQPGAGANLGRVRLGGANERTTHDDSADASNGRGSFEPL